MHSPVSRPTPASTLFGSGAAAAAKAMAGVTWQRVSTVLGLSFVWAWSTTVHELPRALAEHELVEWTVERLGGEFACMVLIALVMVTPLLIVGNLDPREGWRRYAALAIVIAVASAPMASLVRIAYLAWTNNARFGEGIRPSLYIVFWFRYAQLAALLTIVVEFQRRETRCVESMHRAEIDRLRLDREMDEARLQVLQAQIEPHFLFNTLANVRRLYQTDLALGSKMLHNLMRYLEVALPHMRDSHSTVARELALAEAYLNVQHIRMGPRLTFSIDIPGAQRSLALPPMMLLTLVENAIKHGLNPVPEGGTIQVRARIDPDGRLRIDVEDNGRGFHATSGGGAGLANIHARLGAMYGPGASLDLDENQPRGVIATLRLPALPGSTTAGLAAR